MITNILAKASSLKVNNKIVKIRNRNNVTMASRFRISLGLGHFKIFNFNMNII